jgi:flagellin-like protein
MGYRRRWRASPRRGVSQIIATVILIALTVTAGAILWGFRIYTPPSPPDVSFVFRTSGSNPVWGDPTDCQPQGHWTYPLNATSITKWNTGFRNECEYPETSGNYSLLNTTQIVVSQVSPANIPLTEINLTFICNGTVLLEGTLASMTWFPGSTFAPSADAPTLGWCGTFDAGGYGGGAFSTLYNRLGIFDPIQPNTSVLNAGDTFILYVHTGGYPLDYACTTTWIVNYYGLCGSTTGGPVFDFDDYHGAPPWCFVQIGQCTIYLTYTGNPQERLAEIPVTSLAPPLK